MVFCEPSFIRIGCIHAASRAMILKRFRVEAHEKALFRHRAYDLVVFGEQPVVDMVGCSTGQRLALPQRDAINFEDGNLRRFSPIQESRQVLLRTLRNPDIEDSCMTAWLSDPEAVEVLNVPARRLTKTELANHIRGFDQRTHLLRNL
jgi:hypothetical protein